MTASTHPGHTIQQCSECGIIMAQCRCPQLDKTVTYGTCGACATKDQRPPCVVCGEEQVDVDYLSPIVLNLDPIKVITIGFPVCYVHDVKDLVSDQHLLDNVIVEVK